MKYHKNPLDANIMANKNKNKNNKKDKDDKNELVIARNKKAWHDYEILEAIEAGIVLTGSEVKSLRESNAVLTGAFARIRNGEVFLEGLEIQPYSHSANSSSSSHTKRPRKLLLHRAQIDKWSRSMDTKNLTITALSIYLTGGIIKVEIGLSRGKKSHDKRQDLKKKDTQRGLDRLRKLSR